MNIRIHNINEDIFFTVANTILEDKEMEIYIELFENLKTCAFCNRENKRRTVLFNAVCLHCDF